MIRILLPAALSLLPGLTQTVEAHSLPQDRAFRLQEGDRICLLGGALAERMQHDGWLETRLQQRLPALGLSLRNLGFSADELAVHQRTMNFGKAPTDPIELDVPTGRFVAWDRYLEQCGADVVFAFFGYNESFAGEAGLEQYRSDLSQFIEHLRDQRYNGESAPRLVLFSSIPQEDLGDPNLPDGREHNSRIRLYASATKEIAAQEGVHFVDLYGPMLDRYRSSAEPLTINGIHLTERGNQVLADVIAGLLHGAAGDDPALLARTAGLRALVRQKNLLWFNHYRATDGYNVYGGRSRLVFENGLTDRDQKWSNYEVLQREMAILDAQAEALDRRIWALVEGQQASAGAVQIPPRIEVATNKPGPDEGGAHRFISGEKAITLMTPAEGMAVNLFADEAQFPELVNPVQMAWDTRGRLWVAAWATYPHWEPGRAMNDKLLILEDEDGDGRADTCRTFADDLHNPTGFEFLGDGVVVGSAPDLIYLEDTDGDDRADRRERLLHGLSSADTHHSANSFVLGPDGALYFQEGTFHMSQVETIHGPVRNRNACVWRFDPRTWRVERYAPYNFANPHGHVFDAWGQDFVTDGTSNQNYFALTFNGYMPPPAKHPGLFTFFKQRSRPAAATEILSSEHFPPQNQGNYLIANVIGFRGIFQYEIVDDGSGFGAREVEPIVFSDDPNFRPTDLEMGPDGALYFLDWHNPIIGHMQHHLRDPSRDASHGRVYRVTYPERDLLSPAPIAGRPIEELLTLLEAPDDRVRYRARIELDGRSSGEVLAASRAWIRGLDSRDGDSSHHLLEGLWLSQRHGALDLGLLRRLLRAEDPRVRSAATRVLRYGRRAVPDALELLRVQADDSHPRVRLEAAVAASAFDDAEAALIALRVLEQPMDKFLDYGLAQTMKALEPLWRSAIARGDISGAVSPAGVAYLLDRVEPELIASLPRLPSVLQAILVRGGMTSEQRIQAAVELAQAEDTTVAQQLLAGIRRAADSGGPHQGHVIHDLGGLLLETIEAGAGPEREQIAVLVGDGEPPLLTSLGQAALMTHDRSADWAWEEASATFDGLTSVLGAVAHLRDDSIRASLFSRVRPLMFSTPARLDVSADVLSGTGPRVSFFQPDPASARLEAFAACQPDEVVEGTTLALNQGLPRSGDAFGLHFEALLLVPASGEYTFFVKSDDGSRLFLDGDLLIDNDGDHGPVEKSGKVELRDGAHPLALTYFDSGGGQTLEVSWSGPGFDKTTVPAEVLASPSGPSLRPAAIRAMAHVPGNPEQKFADGARLIAEEGLLTHTVEMLRAVPADRRPAPEVLRFVQTLAAHVAGLPREDRARVDVIAALEFGRELADGLGEGAEDLHRELNGLGASVVLVRTIPHAMIYDLVEFWVPAGEPVALLFQNNDVMPHNLVITRPGAVERVGQAAELLPGSEVGQNYVPDSEDVLWNTPLVLPGDSQRLAFVAPDAVDDYPFVCTFPGHWRVMNGVMHVVEAVAEDQQPVRREMSLEGAAARDFVKTWTSADFEDAFGDGWTEGRSVERGAWVFADAGCIKCHSREEDGQTGGPTLSGLTGKYKGPELLLQVLSPSEQILAGYGYHYIQLDDGTDVIGRIVGEDKTSLQILENLQDPSVITVIEKAWIEGQREETLSPMPTGLLVTFSRDEILDLLAFLLGD